MSKISCHFAGGIELRNMKVLELILSVTTTIALVVIAVQLTKVTQPVIHIAAPQVPAPVIEEVTVQVDVPAPELQNVEVKVPAPVIETVKVNVPTPEFSGRLDVDFPSSFYINGIGGTVDISGRVEPKDIFGFKIRD